MTAPTEGEIRALVDAPVVDVTDEIGATVYDIVRVLQDEGLWTDLRPSQEKRLEDLIESVYAKTDAFVVDELIPAIRGFAVEAALTFAAEYPDAPRAAKEAVPA